MPRFFLFILALKDLFQLNFFFIKTDDAAVTFAYSLYHNSIFFVGLLDQC